MFLRVLICPMYFGGYNESLMALNAKFNIPSCYGVADWTVNPPVLQFNFSISQEALTLCGNNMNVSAFHFKAINFKSFNPTDLHNVFVWHVCWLDYKSSGIRNFLRLLPNPVRKCVRINQLLGSQHQHYHLQATTDVPVFVSVSTAVFSQQH